jgi:hypothetical protein
MDDEIPTSSDQNSRTNWDPIGQVPNTWAVEHYGFDEPANALPSGPITPTVRTSSSSPAARGARRPLGRGRGLMAVGALVLALVGGLGGFVVAASATPDQPTVLQRGAHRAPDFVRQGPQFDRTDHDIRR